MDSFVRIEASRELHWSPPRSPHHQQPSTTVPPVVATYRRRRRHGSSGENISQPVGPKRRIGSAPVQSLATVAPAFVEMAHRIVWCIARHDRRRRAPTHPRAAPDLGVGRGRAHRLDPHVAALAEGGRSARDAGVVADVLGADPGHVHGRLRRGVRGRTATPAAPAGTASPNGPAPVGYDPAIIPFWPNPDVPEFGVLRLTPTRLRVMPGTVMTAGAGELLTWRA